MHSLLIAIYGFKIQLFFVSVLFINFLFIFLEEVKEATPLQSEGDKDSSEIKTPSENLIKKENASNVETEQTSENIVVETDISAVTEANKDETLKEVAETKTKNENTSEKPENKR